MLAGVKTTFFYLTLVALPVFLLVVAALQSQNQEVLEQGSEAKRVTSLVLVHQLYGLLLLTGLFVVFLRILDAAAIQEVLTLVLTAYKIPFTQEFVKALYLLIPGGYAAVHMTILFLNGIAAQQILKGQGNALMATPDLQALELPFWPWVALAVGGIVAFAFPQSLWGIYGRNVLLVLHVLFLLQGLSVAHAYAKTKTYGKGFLVSLYFFTFAISWLGLLIAGLGVVEPWLKLRQRFISQKRGDH